MKLKLTLDNRGNPDFGQDPNRRKPGTKGGTLAVDGYEGASRACRAYIEANDLGGGNWTGGKLVDETGTVVGKVSYNGVVWGPAGYRVGDDPLWSPAPKAAPAKNPFAFVSADIEVPGYGSVSVSGCERISHLRSVRQGFTLDGRRHEFSASMDVKDAQVTSVGKIELLRDGDLDDVVACPPEVRKAVLRELAKWGKTPESRILFRENDARDARQDVETSSRRVEYARKELAEREAELAKAEAALTAAEDALAEETPAPPAP